MPTQLTPPTSGRHIPFAGLGPHESRRCAGTDHTTDAAPLTAALGSEVNVRPTSYVLNAIFDLLSVSLHHFYGLPAIAGAASASDTYSTWCLACQFGLPE